MIPTLALDIEIYRNLFMVIFKNIANGKTLPFVKFNDGDLDVKRIRDIMFKFRTTGFNTRHFDLPVLSAALAGFSNAQLKQVCDSIIVGNLRPWEVSRKHGFSIIECNHIDLFEVAPGQGGLKLYGGRMHAPKLQDLPIEPDAEISEDQVEVLQNYCVNDLDLTILLWKELVPQVELREKIGQQYEQDMRSKSDAQIAEAIIKSEVQALSGKQVVRPEYKAWTRFNYDTPSYIQFVTHPLRETLAMVQDAEFKINNDGVVMMPDVLAEAVIPIGDSVYRMGIGGLHSSEAVAAHVSDEYYVLSDHDVRSYYPSIILGQGLAPEHMGQHFLTVYRSIYERRLAAKDAGDKVTDSTLKIALNGSFGKFGSKWSILYSPKLLIQTTVTGQLALLMLIEMLETNGIPVVSANTDGIVIKCPIAKQDDMYLIIEDWELRTGFETEEAKYKALYSRDVNSYLAIKEDGSVKQKGALAFTGSKGMRTEKNPANYVCIDAVKVYLTDGTPLADTIRGCRDITRFVTVRTVKGGAVKDDEFLGKVVRWYYANGIGGTINYKSNGYTVPKSEGAKPLMDLPAEFPDDVNYDWYINEAKEILADIGAGHA